MSAEIGAKLAFVGLVLGKKGVEGFGGGSRFFEG